MNMTIGEWRFFLMSIFQAFILGIVQGATEFVPVSSSGHLVLVPWLLGWPDSTFSFEVLVQWGTLIAVFVYFWQDLWAITRGTISALVRGKPLETTSARLGWYIVLGTIPAVVFGFLLKDVFERVFAQPVHTAALLLGTAVVLLVAELCGRRIRNLETLDWLDALIIGLWQVAALLPGISRSGATIGGAVLRGFNRESAARFSFLLSVPAMLGAGLLAILDLTQSGTLLHDLPVLLVGFGSAALSGYLCIRWLLSYLKRHSLYVFSAYCAVVGALCLALAWIR
jgi:undecaprenyl-diphosphatase